MDRLLKKYLRRVKSWLPYGGLQRRRILKNVENSVRLWLGENPDAGMWELEKQFGTPRQIATACVEDMDTGRLLAALRVRRRILKAAVAAFGAALILWAAAVTVAMIQQRNINNGTLVGQLVEERVQ